MPVVRKTILLTTTLLSYCCLASAADLSPTQVVQSYLTAYNAHDVDAMLNITTDDIRWMSVVDDEISVVTSGEDALRSALLSYFQNLPSTQSKFLHIQTIGKFVSVVEEATWDYQGKVNTQCALAIYEVIEGKIANVWYYSEQPCAQL